MRSAWRARLPDVPDLEGCPPQMQEDIRQADHEARTGPPTGVQFGRLGQIYHADFYYPEAAVCYALAEELDPSDYRWPYYRGVLDSEIGRHDVALGHFQKVLSLHPDDPCARLRVGDVYFKMQDYVKATEAYRQALAWPSYRQHALLGLARVAERHGQWQRVVELLEKPVLSGQSLGPAFRLLMSAYRESGRRGDVDRLTSLGEYYGVGNAGRDGRPGHPRVGAAVEFIDLFVETGQPGSSRQGRAAAFEYPDSRGAGRPGRSTCADRDVRVLPGSRGNLFRGRTPRRCATGCLPRACHIPRRP